MLENILNLDAYPIHQTQADGYVDLVARCKSDLERTGMFNLPKFMKPAAITQILHQLSAKFETEAFKHERKHNIYFKDVIPDVPDTSPLYTQFSTSNFTLCADQLHQTALTQLYEWPPFIDFLADVMGRAKLHQMADPLARINAMAYFEGQGLNWHFDRAEFTTTLLLQAPEQGSKFMYRTDLRTPDDPNHAGVERLVNGQDHKVQSLDVMPGTLNVFRGVNTPHCVTPAQGVKPRIIAVFTYFDRPNVSFSDKDRLGFYGRAR